MLYNTWQATVRGGHKQSDMIEQLTHTHTHTYNMPCQVMANTMKKIIKQYREMKK